MTRRTILAGFAAFSCFIAVCWATNFGDERDSNRRAPKAKGSENTAKSQSTTLNEEQADLVNQIFGSRLLEVAAEYKQYERVDQTIRWSPMLCRAPPKPPKKLASLSASDSESTHGKKLYFLYARKPWEYKSNIWGVSGRSGDAIRAPLGQVLVKEAWNPVKVDHAKRGEFDEKRNSAHADPGEAPEQTTAFATDGENTYHAGEKKGLFIMFKTHERTPGTDRGWVYGTVSANGTEVTSVGLVKNCMQCHQDAPYDRQIGLSKNQPASAN